MATAKSSKATTSKATNKSTSNKSSSKENSNKATSRASSKAMTSNDKSGMEKLKTEVASELGVNLKSGYNGNLTAKEAGSIGGEMVRRMIKKQKDSLS